MSRQKALHAAVVLAAVSLCADASWAQVETSVRASVWSGDRTTVSGEDPEPNFELWGRARWEAAESISFHAEGWTALNPVGDGRADIDVREAYLSWRLDRLRINAGRQVFAWGRVDRLNPTDVLTARDMRRLVEEDADTRLGIGAVSLQSDIANGELSAIWAPEFRASELPQSFDASGLPVRDERPGNEAKQFALRYEKFGQLFDWSVTYASVFDRTSWLSITGATPSARVLSIFHPRVDTIGADIATTIGSIGVRAEAAAYEYDGEALRGATPRKPTFALALGADQDFAGQVNISLQALVRASEALPASPDQAPVARTNAAVQFAWRDLVVGGILRVRKAFDGDRGAVEVSAGGFAGGGDYGQVRFGYAIADGVRLTAMAEVYSGKADTLLGRLKHNSLATLGVRFGF